jgi:hypothetical protein
MLAAIRPIAAAHAVAIDVIDVDAEPSLEAAYGELVPVLFAGSPGAGEELCRYRLDATRVIAALAALGRVDDRSRAAG